MRVPLLFAGITCLLAVGFAAVGETVLRRRSSDLWSWNESFLVGLGVCAALVFPLSLALPGQALNGILVVLASCALYRFGVRRKRERQPSLPKRAAGRFDRGETALVAAIALVAGAFVALNFRYSYLWDGFSIWASKAQLLYHYGGSHRQWFPGDDYDARLLTYPPLVPLYEALVSKVGLRFDFDSFKSVFLVFYVSLLAGTYAAGRALLPRRLALAATLLVALLPGVSTHVSAGGYADMPLAAYVAAVTAAALASDSRSSGGHPLPWLIGSLMMVKSEGIVLATLAVVGIVLARTQARQEPRLARSTIVKAAAVIAGFGALRIGYLSWLGIRDTTYGPFDSMHLQRAPTRIAEVARLCWESLINPSEWGLFWAAFLAATAILVCSSAGWRQTWLALTICAGLATHAAVFLFTNWEVALHVRQAHGRLLMQLSPAATVVILLAYRRSRDLIARIDPTPQITS